MRAGGRGAAPTRRDVLRAAAAAGVLTGLERLLGGARLLGEETSPVLAGEPGEVLPFALEPDLPTGVLVGEGLDARRYAPLARALDAGPLAGDDFYVRTGVPPGLPPYDEWSIVVDGAVGRRATIAAKALVAAATPRGEVVLECAGNGRPLGYGLLSAGDWSGVPLADVVARAEPTADAWGLLVEGHDAHRFGSTTSTLGCSWVVPLAEIDATGAFLATGLGGAALRPENGAPVRLVVPTWYGCAAVKWVRRLVAVGPETSATSQMHEFARRTHQVGSPRLARDYRPPVVDLAALAVRVQRRRRGEERWLAVSGLAWGGAELVPRLEIRFRPDEAWRPLDEPPRRPHRATWAVWHHRWQPAAAGRHLVQLRPVGGTAHRLGTGFYARAVDV